MKPDYQYASMNDIIFENRNQAYGAYVLRRDYNKSLQQAMLIMVTAIFLLGFGKYMSDKYLHSYCAPDTDTEIEANPSGPIEIPTEVPPIIPPPPPPSPSETSINSVDDRELRVTQNDQAQDSVPTQEQLNTGNLGITNNDKGTDATPGVVGGTGNEPVFTVAAPPVDYTIAPEKMPVFPGGEEALLAYLRNNTHYPEFEHSIGVQGKTLVRFIVNTDGSVSNVEILRSATKNFSNEAVRVVNSLPKFQPGMQGGKPVRVPYVLPFTFKMD